MRLRITYDSESNAAYIYLADEPALGWRHGKTVPVDQQTVGGMVNLALDDDGRRFGVEVLDARGLLSDRMLEVFDSR